MAFLFAALSLLATSVREVLEGLLQTRAIHLERGIRSLLNDSDGKGLTEALYMHPLVTSLFPGDYDPEKLTRRLFCRKDKTERVPFRSNLPAYIPARNFASALLDLAGRGAPGAAVTETALSLANIRNRLDTLIAEPHVRRAISLALDDAGQDIERARLNIQAWYDSAMDRVSGWYRKETQWILFAIGLFSAAALNVDAVRVADALYTNQTLRESVLTEARAANDAVAAGHDEIAKRLGCADGAIPADGLSCTQARIEKLGLPIGWNDQHLSWASPAEIWASPIATLAPLAGSLPGWLVTALAISLGAPFWFDLLNKFMVIRSTVKPHEKSPEEASEDRQPKVRTVNIAAPAAAPAAAVAPAMPGPVAPPPNPPGEPNRIEADDFDPAQALMGGKLDPLEGQI
jgi:hypothetical protein